MAEASWWELAVAVWLAAAALAGPLALASVGEILCERSGVLNLGLEGVLAAGALAGCAVSAVAGSPWAGLGAGAAAGLALGALHAFFVVELKADQILSGLGLTLGATGAAGYLGPVWLDRLGSPAWLSELSQGRPKLLLAYPPTTLLALAAVAASAWLLARTRPGLAIRAAGDAPEAARALGLSVRGLRWACTAAGGGLGGLAGAALALAYARTWASTLPNGLGWIVIAVVPLSAWRPWRALGFCLLLSAVGALQMRLQILGIRLSASLLDTLPYLATLVAVVAGRLGRAGRESPEPAALGQPLEG